jgi:hypothetical protein
MKYTLLDLVQTIASSMDSDEVNSINDSVEAQQIATIVRTVYFDIKDKANLPEHYGIVNLTASGDVTKPTLMTIPSTVNKVVWIKYNKETDDEPNLNMRLVNFLPLEEFLDRMHRVSETADNVGTFEHTADGSTFTVLYEDDKAPSYYTTFDDNTLLFDSFDSDVESTLQASKTACYARLVIPFTMSDTFTPDLDEEQFSLLLNEAKSLAWLELKQTPHSKAEVNARRGWVRLGKNKYATQHQSDFDKLPNFGRK